MADPGEFEPPSYVTKTGKVLTDADVQALADEAERGYDVSKIKGPNRAICPECQHFFHAHDPWGCGAHECTCLRIDKHRRYDKVAKTAVDDPAQFGSSGGSDV